MVRKSRKYGKLKFTFFVYTCFWFVQRIALPHLNFSFSRPSRLFYSGNKLAAQENKPKSLVCLTNWEYDQNVNEWKKM